ncbi:MAG: DUF1553 domain-containing protein [Planctomycetes bacterium]|nr:DUF1553 domain-containing protein [Planctomycetota bacterium]
MTRHAQETSRSFACRWVGDRPRRSLHPGSADRHPPACRSVGIALASVLAAVLFACCGGPVLAADQAQPVNFNQEIRGILSRNCFACHGPDEEHRKGGLRLDLRTAALQPADSGAAAIVPGKVVDSELIERITTADAELRMPPKSTGRELTEGEVALLKRWIAEGATYSEHWSFEKPVRPALPQVQQPGWTKTAVDHFILSRLERAGLTPNPEADRYALIRRLSLDLRGLPPSPREVDEFVQDPSPAAYEKLVDRFLSDPAFGERWARMWLDLARYADSKGLGSDPLRTIWRYRDWVIDAFNANLPFDQFTREQIAGDLLPGSTLEQKVATAFHRNTMTNTEGGTDDEEFRVAAVKDRVDTTVQVWMGLTMGCAKCHNHKYDPLTQQEYYQFFAIFNQTADNDQPDESPTLPAPSAEIQRQMRELDDQIAAWKKQLETPTPQLASEQEQWESSLRVRPDWVPVEITGMQSEAGVQLKALDDGSILAGGSAAANDTYIITAKSKLAGLTAFRLETIPDATLPQGGAGRSADGNFVLSRFSVTVEDAEKAGAPATGRYVRVELPGADKFLSLAEVQVFQGVENIARKGQASQSSTDFGGDAQRAIDGNTNGHYYEANSTTHTRQGADPWWEVDLGAELPLDRIVVWNRTDGDVGGRLANFRVLILDQKRQTIWQSAVAAPPKPSQELVTSGRQAVAVTKAAADYSQPDFPVAHALAQKDLSQSGWAVGPQIQSAHSAYFLAETPTRAFPVSQLTFRLEHRFKQPQYLLGRFRLSVTASADVQRRVAVPNEILALVDLPAAMRSDAQRDRLAAYYRSIAPSLQSVRDMIAQLEKSRPAIPTVPVMLELPAEKRRKTHVMVKGNFLSPGAEVQPALPAKFQTPAKEALVNRLGVAQWLTDFENPLTARVMVNRFWSQLFGTGIVETEEDFGTQGEPPSHPELLDWLAVEFMQPTNSPPLAAGGHPAWDMKRLLKLLVMSAAYRQSSHVSPQALAKDPRNRWLSRAPRYRLEAEMVRDQALELAGLLSHKSHGPSVFPPQPPGLWQAAFNGERTWTTSPGEDRYRRALYTFWRRTVPYPSMATFDAPSRELCTVRRIRTNTPLQAFVTLNDPVFVEAAQALARRLVREGGNTPADRVRFGLKLCLVRPPSPEQVSQLVELYEQELQDYRADPKGAEQLATDPLGPLPTGLDPAELAAWTIVGNVLLNLDGVLMK